MIHSLPQSYEVVPITAVRPHPKNPRQGDVAAIRESLDANGWFGAVLAQKSTGFILAGNHRYRAACQRGAETIPVLWIDCDDQTALRVLLADNRTSDLADYDEAWLSELLSGLREGAAGLAGTGFDDASLGELLQSLESNLEAEPAGDQREELVERYQILIECASDEEQRNLLERFAAEGLSCRALMS
jgi:ParB-like chromosome segregation protein Spo0J